MILKANVIIEERNVLVGTQLLISDAIWVRISRVINDVDQLIIDPVSH